MPTPPSTTSLAGASVVVLGGSSGMGLATAKAARQAGATVSIAGRDLHRLEMAAKEVGDGTATYALDVSDESAVRSMFEDVERVDHIAVLAGEQPVGGVVDGDMDVFRRAMEVRFWGSLYACRHGVPRMAGSGSITFCSGVAAWRPHPKRGLGAATTAAVEAFGRAMAVELAPIRVNTIMPGGVDTPVLNRFFGDKRDAVLADLERRLPVGRIGQPDDIAHAILFLMGNGYVTGITLRVDGGWLLS